PHEPINRLKNKEKILWIIGYSCRIVERPLICDHIRICPKNVIKDDKRRKQKRPEVTAAHGTVSHNLQTPCGKLLAKALMIWQWPRTLHGTTHRRAISSVGRALRLHRRCRRFEPVIAHHFSSRLARGLSDPRNPKRKAASATLGPLLQIRIPGNHYHFREKLSHSHDLYAWSLTERTCTSFPETSRRVLWKRRYRIASISRLYTTFLSVTPTALTAATWTC